MGIKLADRLKQVEMGKVLESSVPSWTVVRGHVLDILRLMPDNCIHTVVTSPPYWGLREYGTEPQIWGGSKWCSHEWEYKENKLVGRSGGDGLSSSIQRTYQRSIFKSGRFGICIHCSARFTSLGLEESPDLFVKHLVGVFTEVRRVLREDGVCWLNINDTYTSSDIKTMGIRRKNRVLVPERLLIALQESGWYVRDCLVWVKAWQDEQGQSDGIAMPVGSLGKDRLTPAWEPVFMLSKSPDYFFDVDAEKTKSRSILKNVMRVNLQSYAGAHQAAFPEGLVTPLIKLATSEYGSCPKCRAGYAREDTKVFSTGWRPTCSCFGEVRSEIRLEKVVVHGKQRLHKRGIKKFIPLGEMPDPSPCIVLDPFCGSGTTGQVALRHRRSFIGIDLNPASLKEAEERIGNRWAGKRGRGE